MSPPAVSRDQVQSAVDAQQSGAAPPGAVLPCQKCWIEVQLLDDDNSPVAGEPYWIKLPNGEIRQGTLNDQGSIRIDPIPCGTCIVRFPKSEAASVTQVAAFAPEKMDWIEIVLQDENDQPIADEPYRIQAADGSILQGKLGKNGRARHEGLTPGTCQVSFPQREPADFIAK